MANAPFASAISQNSLFELTQASINAGSAHTETMELTVNPDFPAAPSVVTIATPLAASDSAATKSSVLQAGVFWKGRSVTQDSLCAQGLCRFAEVDQYGLLDLHEIQSSEKSSLRFLPWQT